MPRFFFDTFDGSILQRDSEGQDLSDMNAARTAGLRCLPDMASDATPNGGDRRDFIVDIRDEDMRVIYTACMSLLGRWIL